jgi:integrase
MNGQMDGLTVRFLEHAFFEHGMFDLEASSGSPLPTSIWKLSNTRPSSSAVAGKRRPPSPMPGSGPRAGSTVKANQSPRSRRAAFAEAAYLNVEQLRALLSAISTWAVSSPARNLQGLRDFALFTAYLLTGGRSSEIRVLQWQDLRLQAGSPYYHWENKGKSGWDELAVPAWEAIRTYLQLANRLPTLTKDDYIFTPLSDAAAKDKRLAFAPCFVPYL